MAKTSFGCWALPHRWAEKLRPSGGARGRAVAQGSVSDASQGRCSHKAPRETRTSGEATAGLGRHGQKKTRQSSRDPKREKGLRRRDGIKCWTHPHQETVDAAKLTAGLSHTTRSRSDGLRIPAPMELLSGGNLSSMYLKPRMVQYCFSCS